MSVKKIRIFLIPFLVLLILGSVFLGSEKAFALAEAEKGQMLRQIEILKREISVLQGLLLNLQLRQDINASSYLVLNLFNDSILSEKNSEQPYSIASVTKLMTVVITMENIAEGEKITLTGKMLEPFGRSPALFLGLEVSMENLVKAGLIQSTNDACEALSYFLGKERFLELMNQKAKELGMEKTIFYDVHGLNPENRSTASDLGKLLKYIHERHPKILTITKENNFWLPDSSGVMLKFQNVNNFYYTPDFVGGKTGYLPEAKQTLASVFNVNGVPTAIIVLHSNNRQADAFAIIRKIK